MRRLAALGLLLAPSLAPGLAAAATPLTTREVGEFLHRFEAAERTGDLKALGVALSADCRIEIETRVGGVRHVAAFSHDEYLAELRDFYDSLAEVGDYAFESAAPRIDLDVDGQGARVHQHLAETYTADGAPRIFRSELVLTIARRGDGLAVTQLSSRPDVD